MFFGAAIDGRCHGFLGACYTNDVVAVSIGGLHVDFRPNLIHALLCLFNHFYSFVPFLLEGVFRFFDVHLLYVDPAVDLFFLRVVRSGGALVVFKEPLELFLFLVFTHAETVLTEFYKLLVVGLLNFLVFATVCELLKCVAVKDTAA